MVDESTTPEIIIEARKPVRGMPLGFPEKTAVEESPFGSNTLRLAVAAAPPLSPSAMAEEGAALGLSGGAAATASRRVQEPNGEFRTYSFLRKALVGACS